MLLRTATTSGGHGAPRAPDRKRHRRPLRRVVDDLGGEDHRPLLADDGDLQIDRCRGGVDDRVVARLVGRRAADLFASAQFARVGDDGCADERQAIGAGDQPEDRALSAAEEPPAPRLDTLEHAARQTQRRVVDLAGGGDPEHRLQAHHSGARGFTEALGGAFGFVDVDPDNREYPMQQRHVLADHSHRQQSTSVRRLRVYRACHASPQEESFRFSPESPAL
jgi:hypothetical protein